MEGDGRIGRLCREGSVMGQSLCGDRVGFGGCVGKGLLGDGGLCRDRVGLGGCVRERSGSRPGYCRSGNMLSLVCWGTILITHTHKSV